MTTFALGATTLAIAALPLKPGGMSSRLFQPGGRYSNGALVVYLKSVHLRSRHRLAFNRVDDATLAALWSFHRSTAQGMRYKFAWTDPAGAVRTVRFAAGGLTSQPLGPNRHEVEIILEEDR